MLKLFPSTSGATGTGNNNNNSNDDQVFGGQAWSFNTFVVHYKNEKSDRKKFKKTTEIILFLI